MSLTSFEHFDSIIPRLIREVPNSVWDQWRAIKYSRATAEQWPVVYIMKPTLITPTDAIYIRDNDEVLFINRTDDYTYDLMDALGIPHLSGDEITTRSHIARPQSILNRDGSYTTWVCGSDEENYTTVLRDRMTRLAR